MGSSVWGLGKEGELCFLSVHRISCPRKPQYFPLLPQTFREKEQDEGSPGCALSPRRPPRRRMTGSPQLLATPGHNQALGGHVEILTSLGRLRGPSSYYVSRGRGGGGICLRRSPWRPGAEHKGSARTAAGRGKPWRTEPGSEPPAPAVSKREVYGGPQRSTVSVSALL